MSNKVVIIYCQHWKKWRVDFFMLCPLRMAVIMALMYFLSLSFLVRFVFHHLSQSLLSDAFKKNLLLMLLAVPLCPAYTWSDIGIPGSETT